MPVISVVIPTLNAAAHLQRSLPPLVTGVAETLVREVVISDGGSTDATLAIADAAGAEIVTGPAGRGVQLIAGAAVARSEWLLFLHADTALGPGWIEETKAFIQRSGARAAAYRFAFDDVSPASRRVEFWVGVRCAVLRLPYGDQGLLISRAFYNQLGGYRPLPLMEDVDLVRRIGRERLTILKSAAVTSAEKYLRDGHWRRSTRNLWLLARYLGGADPVDLAKRYD